MAKFAIIWMWEANYSERPLIVEAETAERALVNYRMHSIYGDKFWATAKVFAFPADGVKWVGNRPCEPVLPVRPDGSVPELTKPEPQELTELPPIGDLLKTTRKAYAEYRKRDKEQKGVLEEAAPSIHAKLTQQRTEAQDRFRWRAMEYVEMLFAKFPETTKED